MGVIMPIETDEDLEIREILQSVEDALIDRGHDQMGMLNPACGGDRPWKRPCAPLPAAEQ
jgi:hypothetical protein